MAVPNRNTVLLFSAAHCLPVNIASWAYSCVKNDIKFAYGVFFLLLQLD